MVWLLCSLWKELVDTVWSFESPSSYLSVKILKFCMLIIIYAFQNESLLVLGPFFLRILHEYHVKCIYLAGTVLSLGFGAVVGFTLGAEVANHWYQLYRMDTVGAQVKFNEWLQKRA